MTDDPSPTPIAEKQIPFWLAIATMSLILATGVVLVFKYAHRPPPAPRAINTITPAPNQPRIARSGGTPAPAVDALQAARESEMPDGIHPLPTGPTMVKAGDAYLKATRLPEDPAPLFSFGHFSVTDDQWTHGYLTSGVRRILSDPEYAQSLNITPDQQKQLASLPPAPATRWPKETQGRLADLYKKWESAPTAQKPAAANDLITTLRQQAQTHRTADDQAMSQRVAKIRAILTPQQLEKVNPIPRWNLPTATKPATTRP